MRTAQLALAAIVVAGIAYVVVKSGGQKQETAQASNASSAAADAAAAAQKAKDDAQRARDQAAYLQRTRASIEQRSGRNFS